MRKIANMLLFFVFIFMIHPLLSQSPDDLWQKAVSEKNPRVKYQLLQDYLGYFLSCLEGEDKKNSREILRYRYDLSQEVIRYKLILLLVRNFERLELMGLNKLVFLYLAKTSFELGKSSEAKIYARTALRRTENLADKDIKKLEKIVDVDKESRRPGSLKFLLELESEYERAKKQKDQEKLNEALNKYKKRVFLYLVWAYETLNGKSGRFSRARKKLTEKQRALIFIQVHEVVYRFYAKTGQRYEAQKLKKKICKLKSDWQSIIK